MIFSRKPKARPQHPDPAIELKLRSIAAIDGLRAAALRQVAVYQDDLANTQTQMGRAPSVHGPENAIYMEKMFSGRIARAEEGIRQQQEIILGLGDRLDKAITDSGLTDSDLSYLNLE